MTVRRLSSAPVFHSVPSRRATLFRILKSEIGFEKKTRREIINSAIKRTNFLPPCDYVAREFVENRLEGFFSIFRGFEFPCLPRGQPGSPNVTVYSLPNLRLRGFECREVYDAPEIR